MTAVQQTHGSDVLTRAMSELSGALRHELRLLEDVRHALQRQRAAVAANDVEAIDDSVAAVGRTLFTLEEARRRRAGLIRQLLGNLGDGSIEELERALGATLPAPIAETRAAVRRAAESVRREGLINQTVLRRCLEAGDAFLQDLFAASGDRTPVYDARAAQGDAPSRPVLLDRTA